MHTTGYDAPYLLLQARALLAQTYADGGDSFHGLTRELQDAFLMAVADLIGRAEDLLIPGGN